MSRYRKVLSKLWTDDKFPYLSVDAQRLWLYHLTGPAATPFLLYVEGEGAMADNLRSEGRPMPLPRLRKARKELSDLNMAWYADDGSNLVFITNALKQRENGPGGGNSLKTWCELFNELPQTQFLVRCVAHILTMKDQIDHPLTLEFVKALAGPRPIPKPKGKAKSSECQREGIGDGQPIQDTGYRIQDTSVGSTLPAPPDPEARGMNFGSDPTRALWAEAYLAAHNGTPYAFTARDTVAVSELRRLFTIGGTESPPDWAKAIANYLATEQDRHTLEDLCRRYATFRMHRLDRYKKPVIDPASRKMPDRPTPVY